MLLQKRENAVDKSTVFGALLTNLSEALDCLNYEVLIAKPNTYGFTLSVSKLTHNYLPDRKQRLQVNYCGRIYCLVYHSAQFWSSIV